MKKADLYEQRLLEEARKSKVTASKRRKKKKRTVKLTKKTAVVCVIIFVFLSYFVIHMAKMEYEYIQLRAKQSELEQQLEDDNLEKSQLQEEISQSNKKSYIEYLAKKYLGLIYPDEKIYVPLEKEDK